MSTPYYLVINNFLYLTVVVLANIFLITGPQQKETTSKVLSINYDELAFFFLIVIKRFLK